jgi:hypothetical protein
MHLKSALPPLLAYNSSGGSLESVSKVVKINLVNDIMLITDDLCQLSRKLKYSTAHTWDADMNLTRSFAKIEPPAD